MNLKTIKFRIENNIAFIELNRPDQYNALDHIMAEELFKISLECDDNKNIRSIVLTGTGEKAFCAGASFDELISVSNLEEGTLFFSGFAKVMNAMRTCGKLIVGSVQGKAVGGGVGLVAACDYVFATESAAIKLSEFTIGIGPFVIEPAVSRKIGVAGMAALTLEATDWKNAYWAKEKGLFTKVFDSIAEANKEMSTFTTKLASYNPAALVEMKKVLWKGTEEWGTLLAERAAISGKLVLSHFTKMALQKFKK